MAHSGTAMKYTTPEELARQLDCDECALLLDVRSPDELRGELGHLPRVVNIPLSQLPARLSELARYHDRDVVVVCRSGKRSEEAARILGHAGFTRISVLKGGMIAWRSSGIGIRST